MIVCRSGDQWTVIRQADHARLGGQMLALARLPELLEHPRREALLRAVAEHDNGWWEEDAAARIDPATGGPVDFRRMPGAGRREIWLRSVERRSARDPYLAALIAGHFLRISQHVSGPESALAPEESELRRRLIERRAELLDAAGVEIVAALADDRWLRLGDELSLVAATRDSELLTASDWSCAVDVSERGMELSVAPFPWAGATRFALDVRRIPARRYPTASDLGRALLDAAAEQMSVRLTPLESPGPAQAR